MKLLDTLKNRFSGYGLALGAAALLGALGTYGVQQQLAGDCCKPDASCCSPGSPCCAGHKHAHE